jgi:hypothetical protein
MLSETSSATVAREYAGLRTMDGGKVRVGLLAPGGAERSAWRVSLDVGR